MHSAGPTPSRPTQPRRQAIVGSACIVVIALVMYGAPVPRLSEELYLPLVRHTGRAAYLAGDWTLGGSFNEHWVFDRAFGGLAAALPLQAFAWVGRLISWSVLAWWLVKLGTRLGASVRAATSGIGLWLFANQAFLGGEWMFGTFEAKTIGYCCLVAALGAAVDRRVVAALVLLGAAVSFHPGVGLWAGLGLGLTLLALPETRSRAFRWSAAGVLVAGPGIVGALSAADFRALRLVQFVVTEAIPQHADPFFGGARLPGLQIAVHVTALVGMFVANWWWARRASDSFPHRVLLGVQVVTMLAVALAFAARAVHWWSFLLLAPLRVGPLVVPLIFFVNLARQVAELRGGEGTHSWWTRRSWQLAIGGVALAAFMTSPVLAGPRMMARSFAAWTRVNDEAASFIWIRDHTPASTRCLVPVDRQDAFMRAERPIVVNWQAIRYDDVEEWHRRVLQLVGGERYFMNPGAPGRIAGRRGGDLESLRRAYNLLSQSQIEAVARHYRATCIVATTSYRLPVWSRIGDVRVYRIAAP